MAIITSIGTAHLLDLGSMDNIVKAKLEIVETLKEDGVLIVNGDSPELMRHLQAMKPEFNVVTYGLNRITNTSLFYLSVYR